MAPGQLPVLATQHCPVADRRTQINTGRSNSNSGGCGRSPWQINGEHAAGAGNVAHVDVACIRADGAQCDGQSQPEARAVSASLNERTKQILRFSRRKAAALVADVD
jgi:hypothetical protein